MTGENRRIDRRNKVMTALVSIALFQEFDSTRKKLGKSISEVQREMMRDWLDLQKENEIGASDLEARRKLLSSKIQALVDEIHHIEAYEKLYLEHGGDLNEFSGVEAVLERLQPALEGLQARKLNPDEFEFCDACMDEAHHDFVADRHLEIDWLRFRDYVLLSREYWKLTRRLAESRPLEASSGL